MATTAEYLTQLQTDKQSFITKLSEKGVEVTGNETFTELVPKFDEIQGGSTGDDYFVSPIVNKSTITKSIKTIPQLNLSNVNNMDSFFSGCINLISIPQLDTSKVTSMNSTFGGCTSLTTIPLLDTSKIINMPFTFQNCTNLTSIPQLNTSNVTNINQTFSGCTNLITIPQLNGSKINNKNETFYRCNNLTNFGGLTNLGQAYSTTQSANYNYYTLDLNYSSKLTHESLMNAINNLYDIATKGCNVQQLYIGTTNKAKLTAEEISIATSKGWSVS